MRPGRYGSRIHGRGAGRLKSDWEEGSETGRQAGNMLAGTAPIVECKRENDRNPKPTDLWRKGEGAQQCSTKPPSTEETTGARESVAFVPTFPPPGRKPSAM